MGAEPRRAMWLSFPILHPAHFLSLSLCSHLSAFIVWSPSPSASPLSVDSTIEVLARSDSPSACTSCPKLSSRRIIKQMFLHHLTSIPTILGVPGTNSRIRCLQHRSSPTSYYSHPSFLVIFQLNSVKSQITTTGIQLLSMCSSF